jgi:hypothetical protein
MIRKFIDLHYSGMMYKQKGIPHDWLGRMAFIFNLHLFLVTCSIIFNIIFSFDYRFESKIIYYIIVFSIVYFVFYVNNKNMERFISRFEPQKRYKKVKPIVNLINLILVVVLVLVTFYLFIFSFQIQKYI